ncbi:MAG: tyrosine-type recombinase/integrase, partial [Polaromonas sp.]
MLSDYVIDPVAQERLRRRAAGIHLDAFAGWLADRRYAVATIRSYIYAADRFMVWWACDDARAAVPPSSHSGLAGYRTYLAAPDHCGVRAHDRSNAYCGARRFLLFLQQTGFVPGSGSAHRPRTELESRFRDWLLHHRGVKVITADGYGRVVDQLLVAVGTAPRTYTAAQLRAFVLSQSQGFSHSKADTTVTAVRMFIRFLIASGECPDNLQHAIPRVAGWRQASLPRYLEHADIERIIGNCEPSTALGARDRAILLLLARLGLRAGDVAGLRLSDIDWRNGRIRVSGKSQRSTWLPLPQDAGDAVLHYLGTARHAAEGDSVFLTTRAPYTPIITRQVSSTAERAIRRAGIKAPSLGAHLFRHSAATAWLRQGLSLQAVGAVL